MGGARFPRATVRRRDKLSRSDHPAYRYGAGLYTNTTAREDTAVFHYGHEHGFSAATRLTDNGLRIVCLSNNADIYADHVASHIVQRLTHGSAPDEIHTYLGAFSATAGTAPKRTAVPTDPPAPADQHTWLGTFACDEVPGVLRLSRHGRALYLWRRGTADQLSRTCTDGQTYAGPGYTLTVSATDTLTNDHLNAFTLDLLRAPALHYQLTSSGNP